MSEKQNYTDEDVKMPEKRGMTSIECVKLIETTILKQDATIAALREEVERLKKEECDHDDGLLIRLLTDKAIKKINGGNLWWCKGCGIIRHIDTDGTVRWTRQPNLRTNAALRARVKELEAKIANFKNNPKTA